LENLSLKVRGRGTRKAESSGFAYAIAGNQNVYALRICGVVQSPVADVIDTGKSPKRSKVMVTPLEGRSVRFTHRGRRCTPDAAIRTTIGFTDMEAVASRFASNGLNSTDSLLTWVSHGRQVYPLIVSTIMATTSQGIAGGRRQKSKQQIVKHGAAVVARQSRTIEAEFSSFHFLAAKPEAKKSGGG